MKICQHHENHIKLALWAAGIPPNGRFDDQDSLPRALNLLQMNAMNQDRAIFQSPADTCMFCHGFPEAWITQCAQELARTK